MCSRVGSEEGEEEPPAVGFLARLRGVGLVSEAEEASAVGTESVAGASAWGVWRLAMGSSRR